MKRNNLITGSLYVLFGTACLLAALLMETKLEGILWGLTGAGLLPGVLIIFQYFYWNAPRNRERYQERLENERIEQRDELKRKIRDEAGRYAYSLGLVVISVSVLGFAILGVLGVMDARVIVLYLGGYLLFQVCVGMFMFNRLMKQY